VDDKLYDKFKGSDWLGGVGGGRVQAGSTEGMTDNRAKTGKPNMHRKLTKRAHKTKRIHS
jgi:hypothetical protein